MQEYATTSTEATPCHEIPDCLNLMIIEVGVKTFPSFLFLILALVRFYEIKSIGFASRTTVYSKLFVTKQIISYILVFFYLSMIIIIFALPDSKTYKKNVCWFLLYSK
jgi:hypothetical protein